MTPRRRWLLLLPAALLLALLNPEWRLWVRILAGSPPAVWNWCPRDVSRVQAADGSWSTQNPDEIKVLCAARLDEPVETPPDPFSAVMKAENPSGQLTFVERAGDVFRADGHVFRSYQFEAILRKRTKSP